MVHAISGVENTVCATILVKVEDLVSLVEVVAALITPSSSPFSSRQLITEN